MHGVEEEGVEGVVHLCGQGGGRKGGLCKTLHDAYAGIKRESLPDEQHACLPKGVLEEGGE